MEELKKAILRDAELQEHNEQLFIQVRKCIYNMRNWLIGSIVFISVVSSVGFYSFINQSNKRDRTDLQADRAALQKDREQFITIKDYLFKRDSLNHVDDSMKRQHAIEDEYLKNKKY